jgi:capsular exopolysaccharide synthesis family protein
MDTRTVIKQVALSLFARRKKWIVLTTLAALALLLPFAYILSKEPPRFRTVATVLIENKAGREPVFQEFTPNRPLPVQLAILRSRLLATSVVEALPKASVDDLIRNPYGRDYLGALTDWVARLRGQEPAIASPQRLAVAELQRDRVKFLNQGIGNSGIVEIQAEASQPQIALDIANTYIDVLLARTRSFNVDDAKNTREYLSQQSGQISEALNRSESALRAFTLSRGGVQIPLKNTETAQRLSQLETTLAEVQANKNISQTRLTSLRTKLEAMPASQAPAKPTAAAPAVSPVNVPRLRAKLSSLEAQMVEAKSRYSESHPRVKSLGEQIAAVQRELGDAVKDSTVASPAVGTIPVDDRNAFAEMVAALDTSVVSLTAQENALKDQVTGVRRDLSGLSKDELEYRRLASDVETNRKLSTLLSDKLGAARIREQGEMNVVKVIDPPGFPTTAPNARRMQFMGLALALALIIGLGAPATAEYFNRPIMGETDVKQLTGLSTLSAIPQVQSQQALFSLGDAAQTGPREDYHLFVDSFRRLRVELQMIGETAPLRRILIASALPFEGKSTVVFNLGLAFGEVGKRVVIADADFHRPTLHRIANTVSRKGFTDLLAGTTTLGDTITPITENVQLAPRGGALTASARNGLGTDRLTKVLGDMSDEADYVLMDSSPILLIPDNLYMAAAADGIVLVVAVGLTRPRDLLRTKALLERAGTPIVGVVLNRTPVKHLNSYYKQYSAYYGS